MRMSELLGLFMGISLFAALSHIWVGARGERAGLHRAIAGFALTVAAYVFCSSRLASAPDVETYRLWSRIQGVVSAALAGTGFVFAQQALGRWNRTVFRVTLAGLLAASVASLLLPAGIFYRDITALRYVDSGLGPVAVPVATATHWEIVFEVFAFLPLLLIALRSVRVFVSGNRLLATMAALAVLLVAVPGFIDTFVLGVDTFAAPVDEAGMVLSLIFLSVVVSEDVARAAGLRGDLAASEARHRWMVETSPEAIGVYDQANQRFVLVNPAAEALFGASAHDLLQAQPAELAAIVLDDPGFERSRELVQRALQGEPSTVEWTVKRADGTPVPCEVRIADLGSAEGGIVRMSLLDIRERKAREQQRAELAARVRRSEQLQTIGTLTTGIAHTFNDMLMPLVGFAELAVEQLQGHETLPSVLEMQSSAYRARDLCRQILTLSDSTVNGDEVLGLQSIVKQALRLLRAAVPPRIAMEQTLEAPDVHVRGDTTRLHRIVMNLGLNAAQAMDGGGVLRVGLRQEGGEVALQVADTGHGMDDATQRRIFDPFFTTREPGGGTGLGLSIVRDMVDSLGGRIKVESSPGQGAVFTVHLPVASPHLPADAPPAPPRRGRESLLLVDDDRSTLEVVERLLAGLGYRVSGFQDPQAALLALGPDTFDACITDFEMPGMDGIAFARRLRDALPGLPLVLMSGSSVAWGQPSPAEGPWATLPKPFGRAELGEALRAVLGPELAATPGPT